MAKLDDVFGKREEVETFSKEEVESMIQKRVGKSAQELEDLRAQLEEKDTATQKAIEKALADYKAEQDMTAAEIAEKKFQDQLTAKDAELESLRAEKAQREVLDYARTQKKENDLTGDSVDELLAKATTKEEVDSYIVILKGIQKDITVDNFNSAAPPASGRNIQPKTRPADIFRSANIIENKQK